MSIMSSKCEKCGKEIDGSFGSGRFCSRSCANSKRHSEETKKRISEGVLKHPARKVPTELKRLAQYRRWDKKEKIFHGIKLGITCGEYRELREKHKVCMICGKEETTNTKNQKGNKNDIPNELSIDHDHNTGKFRGFLCCGCNRRLGWYEAVKEQVDNYLEHNYSTDLHL